ncbi:MAG TPA: response regulator [Longimicrobiales bacterium]|nr:response regulator [Longimicrobiales bacterium]
MSAVTDRAKRPAATILVLDDDIELRSGTVRALARAGHRVLAAATAAEALRIAADWPATIDLLICDLVLPGLSGREAANALQAHRPGMKVLFISGYSSHDSFRGELAGGGSSFLGKPYDLAALAEATDALLAGGGWPRTSSQPGEAVR